MGDGRAGAGVQRHRRRPGGDARRSRRQHPAGVGPGPALGAGPLGGRRRSPRLRRIATGGRPQPTGERRRAGGAVDAGGPGARQCSTAPDGDGRGRRPVHGGGRADRAPRSRGGSGGRLAAVAVVSESPSAPETRGCRRGGLRRGMARGDRPGEVRSAGGGRVARPARPDPFGRRRCVLGGGDRSRRVRRAIGGRPDRAGPHRRRRLPGGGDRRAVGGATPSPDRLCLLGVCRPSAGVGRTLVDHRRGDGAAGRRAARRRGTARLGLAPRSPPRTRPAGAHPPRRP